MRNCSLVFLTALAFFSFLLPATVAANESIPADRLLPISGPQRYEVIRGRQFTVQVFLDQTELEDVEMSLPELPPGINVSDVPVLFSRSDGVVEARIEITAQTAGRFVIDSIQFDTTIGTWYVPRLLLEVAPASGTPVPFRARWRVLHDTVYQGQSVPVLLEIIGIDSFTYPDSITVRPPQTGLFEEISGVGSVVSDRVAGIELFQIPVAVFLFTSTSPGAAVLPAADVTALDMTVSAPQITMDIESPTGGAESTGAVGRLNFQTRVDKTTLSAGEILNLEMVIEGSGNFPVLEFPSLVLSGFVIVDQDETGEFQPDVDELLGYRGERRMSFRLEPAENMEQATVRVNSFSYLDLERSQVVTEPARFFSIDVAVDDVQAQDPERRPESELLSIEELSRFHWLHLRDVRWPLFFFLLGPAVFAMQRLLSVRRKPRTGRKKGAAATIVLCFFLLSAAQFFPTLNMRRLTRAEELIAEERVDVAGVLYDLELQSHPNHAGLHYNRGVLATRADNALAAVYHLRRAVRLAPQNRVFHTALFSSYEYFDLPEQINIPFGIRSETFLILFLLAWTIFWLVLIRKPTLGRSIAVVSLLMVGIISLSGLFWSLRVEALTEGIVQSEVVVRRIPDESAEPWVQLAPATTVEIELSYNTFYLVRTSSGVTGWVPQTTIRRLGGEYGP